MEGQNRCESLAHIKIQLDQIHSVHCPSQRLLHSWIQRQLQHNSARDKDNVLLIGWFLRAVLKVKSAASKPDTFPLSVHQLGPAVLLRLFGRLIGPSRLTGRVFLRWEVYGAPLLGPMLPSRLLICSSGQLNPSSSI